MQELGRCQICSKRILEEELKTCVMWGDKEVHAECWNKQYGVDKGAKNGRKRK